jgi:hypothetical protein
MRDGSGVLAHAIEMPLHRTEGAFLQRGIHLECAPEGGRFQATGLTICRACWFSNCTGLRYPSAECSLRAL